MMTLDEERKKQTAKRERERELSGLPPAKKFVSHDPMHEFHQSVDEATRRGREDMEATNRFLAHNPASFANRRAVQAAAQRKNQPAIDLLKAGACPAFNPIAQKQKA